MTKAIVCDQLWMINICILGHFKLTQTCQMHRCLSSGFANYQLNYEQRTHSKAVVP